MLVYVRLGHLYQFEAAMDSSMQAPAATGLNQVAVLEPQRRNHLQRKN